MGVDDLPVSHPVSHSLYLLILFGVFHQFPPHLKFFPSSSFCRSFKPKPLCRLLTHTHTRTQFFSLSHTKACLSSTYRLTDQQVRPGPAASAEAAAVWMWGSAGMQHEKKAFNPSYIHTHSHISQWKVLKPPFLKLCKFWEPLGSRIFLLNKVHTHALTNFQSE